MTARINRLLIPLLTPLASLAILSGCDAGVPKVHGSDPVLPTSPLSRAVQALSSPSTANTKGGSGNDAQAYCLGGEQTVNEQNLDGTFVSEWDCAPGGGIDKVRNEGQGDNNGDGHYDQITTFESGAVQV
jgi:hypothetical protein